MTFHLDYSLTPICILLSCSVKRESFNRSNVYSSKRSDKVIALIKFINSQTHTQTHYLITDKRPSSHRIFGPNRDHKPNIIQFSTKFENNKFTEKTYLTPK